MNFCPSFHGKGEPVIQAWSDILGEQARSDASAAGTRDLKFESTSDFAAPFRSRESVIGTDESRGRCRNW